MHEMALCESLLDSLRDAARAHGFAKVTKVRLVVGPFAGVEVEALRFGFDVVMRGSLAEDARLEILDEPGTAWCFDCNETVGLPDRLSPCPACGGERLRPNGGTDMRIKDLEVM
ncbi:hydrogenase maturation nickel metallochaperone HypA [Ancylobacter sonchi]|uniref:hydrogenase maturation nickel metallochaperone HypA n=1 Tax=Ancylobacter sonchi TaxID=1937790 RepID=UPI001BD3D96E|nr:hydrogenase maturation nickel metallochaperone HypA [Ancylobacter sonchi]MBS7534783.1 hydrogenase maturation nickel metallochaperone HypA [Ancylobacter sonchi]